jgi:hypothetical protein
MDQVEQPAQWRKSTFSANDDCVEWSATAQGVRLRNSKSPQQELFFTTSEWAAFLAGAKAGEADL